MKGILAFAPMTVAVAIAASAVHAGTEAQQSICDSACAQSALLRLGMNLEVSERIRRGDTDGALRLLNTMNVLEVTPILRSPDDKQLVDMKRRVFGKLAVERSKFASSVEDPE